MSINQYPTEIKSLNKWITQSHPISPITSCWRKPDNTGALAVRAYSHNVIGALGEAIAAAWLRAGGYHVSGSEDSDLRVVNPFTGEALRVEVKTARRGKDGCWRATLEKTKHTSIRNADHLILLCVDIDCQVIPFSIPTQELRNHRVVAITSRPRSYSGQWSAYRVGWGGDPL